jgi:hypothetical protein
VEEQAHDPLADAIVDLPGEAAALVLLPFHELLRELLQRLLPLGQPGVQPGVLYRPGDQASHRPQQFNVRGHELAAQLGVHVQHPDQVAERCHHGDRQHGGELFAAQRGNVAVPGIRRFVVDQHGRLPVRGDPPRHALAEAELDLPDQAVERGRGPSQLQRAPPLVEQVHEADICLGGLGDEGGHALEHPVEIEAGRDRVDDPGQQLGFTLRVAREPWRGQWKTPSRNATATAAARSDTLSLR